MIGNLQQEQFVEILHQQVRPTTPIQSQEHLHGRQMQVRAIQQALCSPGRSVFIYGDRGVGKTSLAQTVAFAHQSSNRDPVILACTPETTFSSLISDAISALERPSGKSSSTTHRGRLGVPGVVEYEVAHTRNHADPVATAAFDLNGAIDILSGIGEARNGESTVVIVDEFDRIASEVERTHFADFIKQLGDKSIRVRFIFCGVADSLEKLLGAHASCYRYLESVEVQRLNWEARWEIIDSAAAALNIKIGTHPRFRIAAISDGFPHYIHLVCEKLFWQMYDDPQTCDAPSAEHYRYAVAAAVSSIEQHLKQAYERATMKGADGYEEALWAVADHSDLIRKTDSIHDSYSEIVADMSRPVLERSAVTTRLNALKSKACGQILSSNRRGWYQFRESIMRGYVRLRAEAQGLELAFDYESGNVANSSWRQQGARRSRLGTSAGDWNRIKNPHGW
jgi:archaellum biogenesis ATPase FlaH